ncbi:MAG: hypothetical protein ACPL6C_01445, partial [bacterium]
AGYAVSYTPMIEFPPATRIRYTVRAVDFAGNVAEGGATFTTRGESPPDTVDDYPPCVMWATEDNDTVPPNFIFRADVCDRCPDVPIFTGINRDALRIYLALSTGLTDITSHSTITPNPDCGGFSIRYENPEPYTPGTIVGFQVIAQDLAGNTIDPIHHYYIGSPTSDDVFPPCVINWRPDPPVIPADSTSEGNIIGASICDICEVTPGPAPATGVNRESIEIIGEYEGTRFNLTPYAEIFANRCMGYDFTIMFYYIYLNLHPSIGDEFDICVSARDNAGNSTRTCHTYQYGELPRDIYPPCIYGWRPERGDSGVSTATGIFVNVCDICPDRETPVASGIERENIRFTLRVGDGAFEDVTEFVEFHELDCYGFTLEYHPMIEFPPATRIEACVRAVDNAGNVAEECSYFFTEGEIIPGDTIPPNIELSPTPGETLDLHDAIIHASTCDIPVGPPGVNPESIEMVLTINGRTINVTDRLIIEPNRCFGYEITLLPIEEYEPGAYVFVQLGVSDYAGNRARATTYFYITPEIHPVDTIPPCVVEWHPDPRVPVAWPPDVEIWANICDTCYTYGGIVPEVPSGVEPSSITMTIRINEEELLDVTPYLIITENDCYGVRVSFTPWEGLFSNGDRVGVVISGSDRAHNPFRSYTSFTIREEIPADTTAPCIVGWFPPSEVPVPIDAVFGFESCDICDGSPEAQTGVNPETIELFTFTSEGETLYLEPTSIEPTRCLGYRVSYASGV